MDSDVSTSDAEQGLAQRRAAMFATLGFAELVRIPWDMELWGRLLGVPGRPRLSLADYVRGTGTPRGATAAGGG
jgi:hypothetical protein